LPQLKTMIALCTLVTINRHKEPQASDTAQTPSLLF
jgi:hypothetical protein